MNSMKEVERTRYLKELNKWKDRPDIIKVVTGVRRSGKSTIMKQFIKRIDETTTDPENILFINFESSDYDEIIDHRDLNTFIATKIKRDTRAYIFLDEVQRVKGWERSVNSLMVDYDADVYITGSNAYLLSSELSTYLSGRYVEITVLPFSFSEFLKRYPTTQDIDRNSRFQQYIRTGGIPLTDPNKGDEYNAMILEAIYSSVLMKDVATRMGIRDLSGLNRISKFLLDNTGNTTNVDNIAKTTGLVKKTVVRYMESLTDGFLFYKVERYDVIGKKLLNSHEKYYPVDTGFARAVLNRGRMDISRPLENIVFLELIRRKYRVHVGSFRDREVDFTAEKDGRVEYYQICLTMLDDNTFERVVRSLKAIDDNYPKIILSLDTIVRDLPDGLIHMNTMEWLLGDETDHC